MLSPHLIYKTDNKKMDKTYDFQKFKTIRSLGREMYSGIRTLNDAFEEQINLKDTIDKFKEYTKPKNQGKKEKKALTFRNAKRDLKGRQKVLHGF